MFDIDIEQNEFDYTLDPFFSLGSAPSLMSRTSGGASLVLTELRSEATGGRTTIPMPEEDAFLISLHLKEQPAFQVWEEGVVAAVGHIRACQTVIHDLRRSTCVALDEPFHSLNFRIPRQALDEAADACDAKAVERLSYAAGIGIDDDTVVNLIRILAAGFRHPSDVRPPLFDHVCLALVTHVAQTFGGMTAETRVKRGGLAPWQKKRVLDMIGNRSDGTLAVGDLARECRISHRHFCRAFRQSMGIAPHFFMQNARIDQAKTLLAETDTRLGEVGIACGFADQSHFTRVFAQLAGMTPGAWRRKACPVELRS